ncbi:PREDICTED: probable purine permease 11 isoform X2 [Ipomoea nil]|uniref:probable purine permease 11 isoform X2 n=1 Tax=Ipomoea nil TaxID=35883 RepID=UPI000900ADC8|nr:PREDICTED: probable purine permease 11 isoform X2 [Ipomoea nil]
MGEVEERLLDITSDESEGIQDAKPKYNKSLDSYLMRFKWWIELSMYTFLSLGGQAGATLLGKVYYDQGGTSKWLVATLQTAGFPFLIPFLLLPSSKTPNQNTKITKNNSSNPPPPSLPLLASVYTFLGVLLAAGGVFYSVAIEYLSASTFSLLLSSQLAFTAILALFINAQRFTPYILNSVVLLAFSPLLLVIENDNGGSPEPAAGDGFMLGALFTVASAASLALLFSLTELAFEKMIGGAGVGSTMSETLKMTLWQCVVATAVTAAGLFWSGEWWGLKAEMEGYKQGVVSYFLNVVGTGVTCQAYYVGSIALTFKVSSLFSNVVIRLGTPVIPFLSVVFLGEEMSGLKMMALMLSLWGFASYIYQQYLDELKGDVDDDENQSIQDFNFSA